MYRRVNKFYGRAPEWTGVKVLKFQNFTKSFRLVELEYGRTGVPALGVEARLLGAAAVYDHRAIGDRDRRFGDVRGDHHLGQAARRVAKGLGLLGRRQRAVQRDLGFRN